MLNKSTVIANKFGTIEKFLITFMYEVQGRTIVIGRWLSGQWCGVEDQLFLEDLVTL